MLAAIQECEALRPTTRELIQAATATPDTHDPALSAARFELFRRALIEHDEAAWEILYQMYECLLASWISRRVSVPLEIYDALISEIWMKLLANIRTAEKFERFSGLGKLLAYLKCCCLTVVVDYIRAQNRDKQTLSLETIQEEEYEQFGREDDMLQGVHYQALLNLLAPFVQSEAERIVLQVVLIENEKPSSVLKWYPQSFTDIEDIYWTRRRLVERLQRSQALKAAKEAL